MESDSRGPRSRPGRRGLLPSPPEGSPRTPVPRPPWPEAGQQVPSDRSGLGSRPATPLPAEAPAPAAAHTRPTSHRSEALHGPPPPPPAARSDPGDVGCVPRCKHDSGNYRGPEPVPPRNNETESHYGSGLNVFQLSSLRSPAGTCPRLPASPPPRPTARDAGGPLTGQPQRPVADARSVFCHRGDLLGFLTRSGTFLPEDDSYPLPSLGAGSSHWKRFIFVLILAVDSRGQHDGDQAQRRSTAATATAASCSPWPHRGGHGRPAG